MANKDITVDELMEQMDAIQGEKRVVYQCVNCKTLIGRRYIPYGLGEGLTINPCLCHLTQRYNKTVVIKELTP
jgi:hypothetical protein